MAATVYDITIEQGATFELPLRWKDPLGVPIDITGYTARMQVRRSYSAPIALLSLTSESNPAGIVLGGPDGTIRVVADALLTSRMPATDLSSRYVYDIELVSPTGKVTRLMQGQVEVRAEVTR